ncbi:unnamed protein product [Caenorhabditis brenneri]
MSLSRPVKFPLLKLPLLCTECVIRNWALFDILFFALVFKRTRRIVKRLKIPLNEIEIDLSKFKRIVLNSPFKSWHFRNESEWLSEQNIRKYPLSLQNNEIPLYISKTGYDFVSYTDGNEIAALIMAMEFLNETFKCSVERVWIDGDNFPESGKIGIKSTVNLTIGNAYSYAQSQKLSLLLENLEVTGTCNFLVTNTEKDFYVDPKLFKCRKLEFVARSAAWITREIFSQFEVAQLWFHDCPFSVKDIVSFVTNWFHSDNKKLEYLFIESCGQISVEQFRDLSPVQFSGRTRRPRIGTYLIIDYSVGLEIVRNDGLVATIYANSGVFLFYIWHDQ